MSEKHFIVKIQNRNGDHENSYVRLLVSDCEKNACQTHSFQSAMASLNS